ncbi:flagellin N-terminal helical domain-containing protein [Paenibacillus elgii]|uniref:flagellin N-terminal helical domain-containing protein n=1 Tax=Paenibacillus elgii TaxID=189691 RepID=UPI0013CFF6E7|nr:flagellin [Paenibacillus elgii]
MIINHNLNAMNAHRNLQFNNIQQGKSSEKLSSGYRINRAADDAAGLSISEKMRAQIKSLSQAQRNAQDGVSLVQTAEGAMNEVSDMLTRMKELATQASNGTYNTSDLDALNKEYGKLKTAINDIANNTKFNGIDLLKDGSSAVAIQTGDSSGVEVNVALNTVALNTTVSALGDITSQTNAKGQLAAVDTAINSVNTARSELGATQNQLEHVFNNLGATTENLQAAESRIRDTDMAKEMMTYTKFNILQQAANSMLAQANQAPQGVLQLLR